MIKRAVLNDIIEHNFSIIEYYNLEILMQGY